MGIGDWGLGPIPNPQSPIPNPHPQSPTKFNKIYIIFKNSIKKINKNKLIFLNFEYFQYVEFFNFGFLL
jgi:hypothetical protein